MMMMVEVLFRFSVSRTSFGHGISGTASEVDGNEFI